jgi:hypothetical protein
MPYQMNRDSSIFLYVFATIKARNAHDNTPRGSGSIVIVGQSSRIASNDFPTSNQCKSGKSSKKRFMREKAVKI